MTTYGVYTDDLKAYCQTGKRTIEECKEWCLPGCVICLEKDCIDGCEVVLRWHNWSRWKINFKWLELGWITMYWSWCKYKTADKVVWRPEQKEGDIK